MVLGVSQKDLDSSLQGEFGELNMYLPPVLASNSIPLTDIEPYLDNIGVVCYKQKRSTRKITNFSSWSEAWTRFSKFMVKYVGFHVHEHMADYYLFMLESEKKFAWSAIFVFDYRHRLNLSIKCSINDRLAYACMDPMLLSTVLDVTAIKPNATKCSCCKAYDHLVSRCPFPEMTKSAPGTEVCQNVNKEICRFRETCFRKHVCRVCGGGGYAVYQVH